MVKILKQWKCEICSNKVEVEDNYEPEYCCRGGIHDSCGCGGYPINPVFCDKCEEKIFGNSGKDK